MADPLVATKVLVPAARAGLVERHRLFGRLDDGTTRRLTLVSAPAGFGKTTLVASWLTSRPNGRAVAWLSLDATDRDPALFWSGVATALVGAVSQSSADGSSNPLDTRHVSVPALLNYLTDASCQVVIILDDYHLVDQPQVAAGMTLLLEHLPTTAHLVICTRVDPDLSLAKWRARGELTEIRAADLRFTTPETAGYLHGVTPTRLTDCQVVALETRTEGWIAALQLAAMTLRGRTDVAAFIDAFTGNHRFVMDYLVEEVLSAQDPDVRDFLLRTAVLELLEASLCDFILDSADSQQMLARVERGNLFLNALDDTRQAYRYHRLFADVLQARLASEQPSLVPILHARASQWCEDHDQTDSAIRHALAAGQIDRATALIEAAVGWVRRHRLEATAQSWLDGLPPHVIAQRPALAVLAAGLAMVAGKLDSVRSWLDLAEAECAASAARAEVPSALAITSLQATIAIYRASLAQAAGDTDATLRFASQAQRVAAADDHLSRGAACGFLGLAAWATGEVREAIVTFEQAIDHFHAAGNVVDELSGTVVLADLWRSAGRPVRAREICQEALAKARASGVSADRATAELQVALAELDLEAGDLVAADQHLEIASAWSRGTVVTETASRGIVARALLARARGDYDTAHRLLHEAERVFRPGFLPHLRPIPALRARWWLSQGNLPAAAEWAALTELDTTTTADYLHEYELLTAVRIWLAEDRRAHDPGRLATVDGVLDRLRGRATESGRIGSLIEIQVLTAVAYEAGGRRSEAIDTLAAAWELMEQPEAYTQLFLTEGKPLIALLRAVPADSRAAQLRRILAAAGFGQATSGLRRTLTLNELSRRELDVLALLDSDLTGPEIARALFLSPNTVRTHTKRIFTKLGVTNRRAAVLRAHDLRLLPRDDG